MNDAKFTLYCHDWQLITLRLHVLKYNMNNFILSQNSNIVKVVTDILRLL